MALTKVSTPAIKDEAITLAKLLHGDSNSNGKFLRANNGADPTFETVNTDLVSDTSPQLGGNLDVNNKNILIGDSSGSTVNRLRIGAGPDLEIYHNGTDTAIQNYTGDLYINNTGGNADDIVIKAQDDIFLMPQNGEYGVSVLGDGAVELYYDNVKKLETTNTGIEVTGRITTDSLSIQDDGSNEPLLHLRADDANPWAFLISNDNYHSGTTQGLKWYVANNGNAYQHLQGNGTFEEFSIQQSNGGGTTNTGLKLNSSRAVELNYQGAKKFETISNGASMGAGTHTLLWPYNGTSQSRSFGFIGEDGNYGKFELKYSNADHTTLNEVAIRVYANAEVQLLHNNVTKFYTTSTGTVTNGNCNPDANNTRDLGTSSLRWANIYTNDLNLSNEGSSNDVDGSWGDWTIQEGESDLFLKNNRSGKKYKFNLTEVS